MAGPSTQTTPPTDDQAHFMSELKVRRDRVYTYLELWPGASAFQPEDIREGLFSYVRHKGKGLRPSLLLLSAGAVGGDEEQAIPAAAAVEIFHIWTLVHDDIIDRDDTRRGNPTVHAQYARHATTKYALPAAESAHYGTAVAILSGDLQQSWAYALMCDLLERGVAPEIVLKLVRRMSSSLTPKLLEGEMLDVQFAVTQPDDLTDEQILHMLSGKSAALLEYAAWAGATIGLAGRDDPHTYADNLGRFALLSGLAFQLQDDLLGLTADEASLGKPVGSDLREGKRTLILHYAVRGAAPSDRETLLSLIGGSDPTHQATERALQIITGTGALDKTGELANSYISQALNILDILPDSYAKHLLHSWANFMLARTY